MTIKLRPLQNSTNAVIPVETGIQKYLNLLDSGSCAHKGIRRNDRKLRSGHFCKGLNLQFLLLFSIDKPTIFVVDYKIC
jgi:hypothetical protein